MKNGYGEFIRRIPVNQALSDVFIKLHITEHTGRGVPRITEAYGKDVIRFNENSIVVTVPFDRLGQEVYGDGQVIPPVDVPVNAKNVPVEDEILSFCMTVKSIWEIAEHLGYKDKRSVRKYLNPLIEQGRIAMTIPDKPNSRFQKYVTIR
jgi:predicted HTH transcriptional regulator